MLFGQRAAGSFHPVEHGAYSTISVNSVESPCAEASHTHVESLCFRQLTKITNSLFQDFLCLETCIGLLSSFENAWVDCFRDVDFPL
jgi:hypothetical protein